MQQLLLFWICHPRKLIKIIEMRKLSQTFSSIQLIFLPSWGKIKTICHCCWTKNIISPLYLRTSMKQDFLHIMKSNPPTILKYCYQHYLIKKLIMMLFTLHCILLLSSFPFQTLLIRLITFKIDAKRMLWPVTS